MLTGGIERSGQRRNCSKLKWDRKDESEAAYTPIHPGPERASAPADTNTNNIAQAQSSLHQHLAIDDDVVIAFVHVSPLDSAVAPGRLAQHHGVVNGIRIWRVVGVAVRRWNFDCGADYTGIAIVGIAATTVVGPVPPASPLPPTIPETLCGYGVDIDPPNPKTGANPVRDIPFDPGPPAPAPAANIKSPPPDPNVPSPPPLRAKHKPSHDFWRANTDTCARR
ncbi:hypothetical protein BU17DRAFT_71971 [Hysterangium stoloniferum]|nr:hypothetical protein BU17DRAFT_71971 [Hysterangium stoloniferum]